MDCDRSVAVHPRGVVVLFAFEGGRARLCLTGVVLPGGDGGVADGHLPVSVGGGVDLGLLVAESGVVCVDRGAVAGDSGGVVAVTQPSLPCPKR